MIIVTFFFATFEDCQTCQYFVTWGEEPPQEAGPVCRHPSACLSGPCRRRGSAWKPSKPFEGEEKKEEEEEKKEDENKEKEKKEEYEG